MTETVGAVIKVEKMSKMTLATVVSEQASWSTGGVTGVMVNDVWTTVGPAEGIPGLHC